MSPINKKGQSILGTTNNSPKRKSLFEPTSEKIDFSFGIDESKLTAHDEDRMNLDYIPLNEIIPYKDNKYRNLDTTSLEISIAKVRLISPIVLEQLYTESEDGQRRITGKYGIIAGERRYTAYTRLLQKAEKDGNQKEIKRYSKIPAIIMPLGMTLDEFEAIYNDSNVLHRPLTMEEAFGHIDYILDPSNMPKDISNLAKYVKFEFDKLGFNWGMTKIKQYVAVWQCNDERLKEMVSNKEITIKQAHFLTTCTEDDMTKIYTEMDEFPEKDKKKIVNNIALEKKRKKNKIVDSSKVYTSVVSAKTALLKIEQVESLIYKDGVTKEDLKKELELLKKVTNKLLEKVS